MFSRWQLPGDPRLTLFLILLWIALLAYAFIKGDPIAWVLAAVFVLFVGLPVLVIYVKGRPRR